MSDDRKRLVLCFDGTWNNLKSHTNVSRLYAEIADESVDAASPQRKFYDEGVGTGTYDKLRGGLLAYGLDRNIRTGYAWLASHFELNGRPLDPARSAADPIFARADCPQRGDRVGPRRSNGELLSTPCHSGGQEFLDGSDIYLFGFSRGAFTARSLGGLINHLGIPKISRDKTAANVSLSDHPSILQAWKLYADRPSPEDIRAAVGNKSRQAKIDEHERAVAAFRAENYFPVRIHFVGVWDTVGALGIPKLFDYKWIPRFSSQYQFHDSSLGEAVRYAFHAVAIDEHRLPYTPTLWTQCRDTTEAVEQRWFPGAHADVGGGYEDDLLPAPPLQWLAQRAAECGLEFINDRREAVTNRVPPSIASPPAAFDLDGHEYLSPVHDSYAEFIGGVYRALRSLPFGGGPVYRRMLVRRDGLNQSIDETAFQKWRADDGYRPPNLGQAGRTDVTFNAVSGDVDEDDRSVVSAGAL
jgi:uncharacterized protein (DUF2235 family)